MIWLKENWMKFTALALATFIVGLYAENSFGLFERLTFTNEKKLQERFNQYSKMIEVGLCQEAFDEFITKGSKELKGEDFFAHCNYRKEDWHDIKIQTVVFSGKKRADIKYTYDIDTRDFTDRVRTQKETIETWLIEGGKWMRDY